MAVQVCIANAGREWSYSGRVEVMGNAIDPSTIRCKVCAKSAAGKMPGTEQCDSDVLNNFHKLDKKPSHVFTDTFDYDVTGCDPAAPLFFIACPWHIIYYPPLPQYCRGGREEAEQISLSISSPLFILLPLWYACRLLCPKRRRKGCVFRQRDGAVLV